MPTRPPSDARHKIADNPFYVLGLPASATRAEVEREGTKLLGMLELGLASAATYETPLGSMPRTAEQVRLAMAALRDPDKRLVHELWVQAATSAAARDRAAKTKDARTQPAQTAPRWPEARRALGFGGQK